MTGDLQNWLLDTMMWTAGLIGLVLLVRRSVAKLFGAKAAYALWALPFLRLILPPITLPAWLASETSTSTAATYTVTVQKYAGVTTERAAESAAVIDWTPYLLAAWLLGMAVFLIVRFRFYFQMRAALLEGAVPVGEDGNVRLVETPGTQSPIAFGVIDKVIALPVGFMALTERTQRDLALEHELAHHRAHDLLANFLVQPLFAVHWFNPLGWYGWRAMRRDQEAACDARVIAARGDSDKLTYAEVIASYATAPQAAPRLSLAAPMACPVIGDKSIIHRLRSLTMPDVSTRRRIAGRTMMGAAVLALPLTASISYAASEAIPAVTPAPKIAATPPAPPAILAMQSAGEIPSSPNAPLPPEAPEVDEDEATTVFFIREKDIETSDKEDGAERKMRKFIISSDKEMSFEERMELMEELSEDISDVEVKVKKVVGDAKFPALKTYEGDVTFKIRTECKDGGETSEWTEKGGKKVLHICKSQVMANALPGLKAARAAIAKNTDMEKSMRDEVLQSLDEEIENWNAEG